MRRERRNFQGAAGDSVSNTAQPTKGKEIMGKRIEDLKETAPCGMLIHYTVNEDKLWIPSEYEIHGREIFAEHVEGEEQFELYKDRRNRMKKVGNNGEDTD